MAPGRTRDHAAVRVAALTVGIIAALPIGYLIWRSIEYGLAPSIEIATSSRTIGLLGSTLLLAVAVTATSVAIAIPTAWLTVRTNLIGRKVWSVVTVLPLAIPTYVGSWAMIGALGPRGSFRLPGALGALGAGRLAPVRLLGRGSRAGLRAGRLLGGGPAGLLGHAGS